MIVGFGVILLVFSVTVLFAMDKMRAASEFKTYVDGKRVAAIVRDNINTVTQQGTGYYKFFSIPTYLRGGYAYNISVRKGVLELSYEGRTYSSRLNTENVTVYSLDKGVGVRNRAYNSPQGVEVTGHRPNLVPVKNSVTASYNSSTGNVSMSVDVENEGHVDSNPCELRFIQEDAGTRSTVVGVPAVGAGAVYTVNASDEGFASPAYLFLVDVDVNGNVTEGKETDNHLNMTVAVSS